MLFALAHLVAPARPDRTGRKVPVKRPSKEEKELLELRQACFRCAHGFGFEFTEEQIVRTLRYYGAERKHHAEQYPDRPLSLDDEKALMQKAIFAAASDDNSSA